MVAPSELILVVGFIALNLVVVGLIVRFILELSSDYRVDAGGLERFLIGITQGYLRLVLNALIHAAAVVLYVLLVLEVATRGLRRLGQISYAAIAREPVGAPIAGLPVPRWPVIRLPRVPLPGRRRAERTTEDDDASDSAVSPTSEVGPLPARESPAASTRFSQVVGNDRAKTILHAAIEANQPVHVLLTGAPGIAKSLLLADLGRLPGATLYAGGLAGTGGLVARLGTAKPRYLVVEDIDMLTSDELLPLITLLEDGIVTDLQASSRERIALPTKVFAGASTIEKLPRPIQSCFAKVEVSAYTAAEFAAFTQAALVQQEGLEPELAGLVAREVAPHSLDYRDAVRVARLARLADHDRSRPEDVAVIVSSLFPNGQVRSVIPVLGDKR